MKRINEHMMKAAEYNGLNKDDDSIPNANSVNN